MSDKQKIERLAAAMGHDVWRNDQGFIVICGLHEDWNPWENPTDLRQVLRHIQDRSSISKVVTQIEVNGTPACSYFDALLDAVFAPSIIADAALEVLEGEKKCTL